MADRSFEKGAAWIDGQIVPISEAKISVIDWGLTRSDITYDVAHVWEGAFFRLDDYLDRFLRSVEKLRLDIPLGQDEIRQILHDVVARSGLRAAYVSMVASRGVPSIPGTRDPRLCSNHFYAWAVPFVWVIKPEVAKRGAHLKIAGNVVRISPEAVDPTVKNYHWGDMTKALFEALDDGYDTVVLVDEDGNITEGPGFNMFAVINGVVVTARTGILEGITRRTVIEICKEAGIPVEVRDLSADEFLASDEAFVSTTGGGATPVTRINERILGNDSQGPVTALISETYWKWHEIDKFRQEISYLD
ncbi:MAG: aminotransferase class IV [Pseudomonadota bacterium]